MLKKLFATTVVCLSSLALLAQGNDLDGRCFTIENQSSLGAFMQDNLDCDYTIEAFGENEFSYWKFISTGNEDCYYIQNISTHRYIQSHGDAAELKVKIGDEPAEYYVKASTGYPGSYGLSSTAATVHNFEAHCIGLNLRNNSTDSECYVQTYAAVDGSNPRSFWLLTEVNEEDVYIPHIVEPEDLTGVPESELYYNPVVAFSLPDPSIIRADDGYFYVYATENAMRGMPIYRSLNLVDWELVGTCFTEETRPTFVDTDRWSSLWAPDVNIIDGKYVMYYAMSNGVDGWTCGIGIATADKPEGPFTDLGPLFISSEMGTVNSIDPVYVEEDGKKYLFWGSFGGIFYTQLTDDGLGLKDGLTSTQVAGTLTEGTYIIKHDGYFYQIGSAGSCCDGVNSTYRLVVTRSESLFGPYVNRVGGAAMDNNWSKLLAKSKEVRGPGHNSEIFEDDEGNWWVLYHGWDVASGEGRYLYLDRIYWDEDGWPCMTYMQPTAVARRPVVYPTAEKVSLPANSTGLSLSAHRTNDSISISLPNAKPFTWKIANTHGALLLEGKGQGSALVDLSSAPAGLYILNVQCGKENYSDKIIKY